MTPAKFLRTAFGIRGLSSAYISRVFLRTEMALKSRSVLTGSRSLARSRSTDNLPTSQSQVNIQMMSHTLTIREVCDLLVFFLFFRSIPCLLEPVDNISLILSIGIYLICYHYIYEVFYLCWLPDIFPVIFKNTKIYLRKSLSTSKRYNGRLS